jgi:hypothetical protein
MHPTDSELEQELTKATALCDVCDERTATRTTTAYGVETAVCETCSRSCYWCGEAATVECAGCKRTVCKEHAPEHAGERLCPDCHCCFDEGCPVGRARGSRYCEAHTSPGYYYSRRGIES